MYVQYMLFVQLTKHKSISTMFSYQAQESVEDLGTRTYLYGDKPHSYEVSMNVLFTSTLRPLLPIPTIKTSYLLTIITSLIDTSGTFVIR